jgi:hypothetical protein
VYFIENTASIHIEKNSDEAHSRAGGLPA